MSPHLDPLRRLPRAAGGRDLQRRRPRAGHRPGGGHRRGADDGVDERRVPGQDASRPAGPGSGAAPARSTGARARPPATGSTSAGRPTTATATPCSSWSSRRARARATPASARASIGISVIRPSRDEFRALARDYTVVPVWRDLLADFVTPVSAFARLVRRRPRLPAGVGRPGRAVEPVLLRRAPSADHPDRPGRGHRGPGASARGPSCRPGRAGCGRVAGRGLPHARPA